MNRGEMLKKFREDLGYTQEEVATKLHMNKQNLYKYEKNIVTNIPSDKLELLAELYNTTPQYLMGWCNRDICASSDSAESVSKTYVLNTSEQKMLDLFRSVNEQGQERIIDYADDVVSSGKYKKGDKYTMVENTS